MCMSVLSKEQNDLVIEWSKENTMPSSAYDEMKIHHESLDLEKLKEVIESIGGKVHH